MPLCIAKCQFVLLNIGFTGCKYYMARSLAGLTNANPVSWCTSALSWICFSSPWWWLATISLPCTRTSRTYLAVKSACHSRSTLSSATYASVGSSHNSMNFWWHAPDKSHDHPNPLNEVRYTIIYSTTKPSALHCGIFIFIQKCHCCEYS